MKSIFGVCLAFLMFAGLAVCLKGGRRARVGEFPFLVRIERSNYTWCMGTIVDPVRIIFPDDCLRRSPLIGFSSADVVPLVNQNPRKKYKGWFVLTENGEFYTEMDVIVIRLEPPGLKLAESNLQNVSLPTRAVISQQKLGPSDVVIVGLNGRVGAMTILDDSECFNRIGSLYFPVNDRLQSTKLLLREKLTCAVLKNTTGHVGDVPPGQACERDLGAPVIQNGAVVGMLVRSFCPKYYPHVALFLRLDHSDEPQERPLQNKTIPEPFPSPIRPISNEVSKRVKRQSLHVKNETEISEKSVAGSEIQCHESSCEAPATEVTSSKKVPVNPTEPKPEEKLMQNGTIPEQSPSPLAPNDQVPERVKRQSQVVKNETDILAKSIAGSEIQCHESSCEAPATEVASSKKVPVNPSEPKPEEKLTQNGTIPEQSPSPLAPNNQVPERVKRQFQVVKNETDILAKSIAGSEIQCHESSCEAPATEVMASKNVPVNASETKPEEKLTPNGTILEQSPSPLAPNNQVSERVKRQSQVVKNETQILEKSIAGSEIQCHESSCEAPATEVMASKNVPVNASETKPEEKLTPNGTILEQSPSPLAPNNQVSERVKRQSQVVKNETQILEKSIAGSEIQCHESSCEAPAIEVTASKNGPANSSSGSAVIAPMPRDIGGAVVSQKRLVVDSMERKEPLLNSGEAKSNVANEMHRVQTSNASFINIVRYVSNKTASRTIGPNKTEVSKRQKRELREVFIPVQEDNVIEKLVRERNRHKKYMMSSNTIRPNRKEVAKRRMRELKEVLMLQKGNFTVKLDKNRKRKHIISPNTIRPNRREVAKRQKRELRGRTGQERRRREAEPPAAATNATVPDGGLATNVSTSLNDTGNANVTGPLGILSNDTGPVGNATSPTKNVTGPSAVNATGNASAPLMPVTGNGTVGNHTVTGNETTKLTTIVPDGGILKNETGGKNHSVVSADDDYIGGSTGEAELPAGGVVEGSGGSNETGEVILSGGDFDLGLERFGGSGNDTSGSGDVNIVSGFGESAQDEVHPSEEELGPEKPPKKTSVSLIPPPTPKTTITTKPPKKESTRPYDEGHFDGAEPVGPPQPNDDRPDFQGPGMAKERHAAFSPKNVPLNFSFLVTICFIVSHI